MIFHLSTTHHPATDLGYLLHKNPARVHEFGLNSGCAFVFYPEATAERCQATLMVKVDPIALVRGKGAGSPGWSLGQYVNDRPYAASSFLSTAISEVYGSALNGRCRDRPELVDRALPLTLEIPVQPSSSGEEGIRRLFEPLGYAVEVSRLPLDEQFPDWGESRYYSVRLEIEATVQQVLSHLYVLMPVLDTNKHYYVGRDEIEKLLEKGSDWLPAHPERDWITRRYLKYRRYLADEALARLESIVAEETSAPDADEDAESPLSEERIGLHEQRLGTVAAILKKLEAQSVLDLGCGEGKLLRILLQQTRIPRILGMDVSSRTLEKAKERLNLDRLPALQRQRLDLQLGSLLYRDARLEGFDAAALVEVIEHLDTPRLQAMERNVFEFARPRHVIVTTPNREYNVRFETLPAGEFRHADHRFEWTRAEFSDWANRNAERFGYAVELSPVGPTDDEVGAPSQMAVFTLNENGDN